MKNKKIFYSIILVIFLFAIGLISALLINQVKKQDIQVASVQIASAINYEKKDVPIDPKTGDLYFPESRLFVPNPKSHLTLTYQWHGEGESPEGELSVSTKPVPEIHKIYLAKNQKELSDILSKVLSCSRGVKISYQELTSDMETVNKLMHTVSLKNGKVAYVYVEESCTELETVAEILKNLQSY